MAIVTMIDIEVVFANFQRQAIIPLQIAENSTVQQAIIQSGILQQFPEIDLVRNKTGIFGKFVSLDSFLKTGDRIEIYHPLLIDPKQARKQRAHVQINR